MPLKTNIKEVNQRIADKLGILTDPKKAKEVKDKILKAVRKDVEERFRNFQYTDQGGVVLGNKEWKPLSDEYLKANKNRVQMPMLNESGVLVDSIIQEGAPGSLVEYTDTGMKIGSKIKYAKMQNKKRPFLFWSEDLKKNVLKIIYEVYQI